MSRPLVPVLVFLAALLTGFTVGCFLVAIWTHGPDASRWAGTGVLSVFVTGVLAFLAAAAIDGEL